MSGHIYIIDDAGQLTEMEEKAYDSEALLQELLAKYPSILAGDQINSEHPRRWLLIAREASVPADEGGAGRWSIDHVFFDQDAIPTIVEVKRSSDTRIRREVVGQMLDYAANAVVYWPIEAIQAQFYANCEANGIDADQMFNEFLGDEISPEEFWRKAKTNLQACNVRLVFVADVIPNELRRVVEFLNSQMDPTEVLAVEVKQYVGKGLKTLVPRVIGGTKPPSPPPPSKKWDENSFFKELESKRGAIETDIARKIYEWGKANARIWWGSGKIYGSFCPVIDYKGVNYPFLLVGTSGSLALQFYVLKSRAPFADDESKLLELLNRINKIPGIYVSEDAINRSPSITLSNLNNPDLIKQFLDVMDWLLSTIKST